PGVSSVEVDDVLKERFSTERAREPLMARDADEPALEGPITDDKLKYYVGKKALSRPGCFACHELPGFDGASPIGTPLDHWRKQPFKFAHRRPNKDESEEEFKARAEKEEAEAREAVMTFILGLVAEATHPKYLNNPGPDRLAEVKGRQVLDKFNCAGCHLVRPGAVDFKLSPGVVKLLDTAWDPKTNNTDHKFHNHMAWTPPKLSTAAVQTHGAGPELDVD